MVAITAPITTPLSTPRRAGRGLAETSSLSPVQIALTLVAAALLLVLATLPAVGGAGAPVLPTESVVADAGDTMWSLAVEHAPAGEAASYVERLVEANATSVVVPGQLVELPAP